MDENVDVNNNAITVCNLILENMTLIQIAEMTQYKTITYKTAIN